MTLDVFLPCPDASFSDAHQAGGVKTEEMAEEAVKKKVTLGRSQRERKEGVHAPQFPHQSMVMRLRWVCVIYVHFDIALVDGGFCPHQ